MQPVNPLQHQLERGGAWVYEIQEARSLETVNPVDCFEWLYEFLISLLHFFCCSEGYPHMQSRIVTTITKERFICRNLNEITVHDLGIILQRCNYPVATSINNLGTSLLADLRSRQTHLQEFIFSSTTTTTKYVSLRAH